MLTKNKDKLLKILNSNPKIRGKKFKNFDISINDYTPLYNLKIKFPKENMPQWIGIDVNYITISMKMNLSFLDQKLNKFKIPIIFYSNRFKQNNYSSTSFTIIKSITLTLILD